ncbi:MAG TPA: hypothetical protein DCE81_03115 [Cytophagales bacterium]|nr:hypothetical protein [Cytophagales bacterium]
MTPRLTVTVMLSAILLSACKPPAQTGSADASEFAHSLLGNDCALIPNGSRTLLLAIGKSSTPRSRVIVLRMADHKVLFDQTFTPGFVRWQTDSALALLDMPEVMPSGKNPDDFIRIINLENPLP